MPTNIWNGKMIRITQAFKIPGHPNLVIKMAIIPAKPRGAMNDAKNIGALVSIVLKSFDNKLIILPNYWFLIVYCDNLDNLQYIRNTNYVLICAVMIGVW